MNLTDIVKKHKEIVNKETTIRAWDYRSRKYYNKKHQIKILSEKSREIIESLVKKWFKDQGWNSKRKRPGRNGKTKLGYTSKKPGHHTYIDWTISERGYACVALKALTPNGGWSAESYNKDLAACVKQALNIPKPTLLSKENLPIPIPIGNKDNFSIRKEHKNASTENKWRFVKCIGVVGLKEDGAVDKSKAFSPTEKPWFFCSASHYRGSTASFITDGDILHPVKTQGKLRVTTHCPPMLKNTTKLDKRLLEAAISTLFNEES